MRTKSYNRLNKNAATRYLRRLTFTLCSGSQRKYVEVSYKGEVWFDYREQYPDDIWIKNWAVKITGDSTAHFTKDAADYFLEQVADRIDDLLYPC